MKKLLSTIIISLLCCISLLAQHKDAIRTVSDTTRVNLLEKLADDFGGQEDLTIVFMRNNNHWFVDAMGGGGFYCAEWNRMEQNAIGRTRPQFQFAVGRWVHPAWGLRLALGGGQFSGRYLDICEWNMYDQVDHHTVPEAAKPYYITNKHGGVAFQREFDYLDAQLDVIYDLTRVFTKNNTPIDLNVYTGPGVCFSYPSQGIKNCTSLAYKLGGQMDVHITDNLGIKFQMEGTIVDESFDGQINGTHIGFNRTVEGFATAMVGLSWRFGRRSPNSYVMVNPSVVERAYNMIPVLPEIEIADANEYMAPFVVRFYIDQYNIEPDQELNIVKVCTYLQQHPGARLLMTGHCDPETANPRYNQALSERRCLSVMKYIDEHFDIDHSRIDILPMGDTQKNFNEDFRWNRCVILTIQED